MSKLSFVFVLFFLLFDTEISFPAESDIHLHVIWRVITFSNKKTLFQPVSNSHEQCNHEIIALHHFELS